MEEQNSNPTQGGSVKTLAIFSIIGSSLYILLGLIGVFAIGWLMKFAGLGISSAASAGASAADIGKASAAVGSIKLIAYISIAIFILLAVLRMVGAIRMMKMKKSGYILYMIANVIITLLFIYGLITAFSIITLLIVLAQVLFIILFTRKSSLMS